MQSRRSTTGTMTHCYHGAVAVFRVMTIVLSALAIAVIPSFAQTQIPVVRDAEIEGLLTDYARPIFKVAGLSHRGIQIVLVNSPSFNAFVAGRRIFVNTGALTISDTPNEIIGVLAHESGHIAGGHQERIREQLARARTLAIVGSLVGIGAAAASGLSGSGEAGSALGTGLATAAPGLAQRALLSYRRSEEINADRAAIKYLNATGQSGLGMLKTFQRFKQQAVLAGVRSNPYESSHPLPQERIALMGELVGSSKHFEKKDSKSLQRRHDMARGKIAAYSGGAPAVARLFRDDPKNPGAQYGLAISSYLRGDTKKSLSEINKLIARNKSNPYLHEMKGEILLAARQPKKAAASFAKAVQLDKNKSGVIRGRLGFAYLSTGDAGQAKKAIRELRAAIAADTYNFAAYTYLSRAYAQTGDVANAQLTLAEANFRAGNLNEAKRFAARAQQQMQKGTPGWQRANDIIKYRKK